MIIIIILSIISHKTGRCVLNISGFQFIYIVQQVFINRAIEISFQLVLNISYQIIVQNVNFDFKNEGTCQILQHICAKIIFNLSKYYKRNLRNIILEKNLKHSVLKNGKQSAKKAGRLTQMLSSILFEMFFFTRSLLTILL